jgi:hypothetical protein
VKRALFALLALAACASRDAPEQGSPPALNGEDAAAISGWGPRPEEWASVRLSVRAAPLAPSAPDMEGAGKLRFRGGLELASEDPQFGGLSGLYVDGEGRLLAVSDQGDWFAARLVHDDAGRLTGLADPRMARLRGADGRALGGKRDADAEGLTRLPDGRFAVSFEQVHVVRLYDLERKGPAAAAEKTIALAGSNKLDDNDSVEALAAMDGALLVAAEGVRDPGAPFWIAPFDAERAVAAAGRTRTQEGFGLVSLDRLPDGDFIAMERFFAPLIGVRIYLRRVREAGLAQGRWEGEPIVELTPPIALDNFEGIAAVRQTDGVRLYMISDNNFSSSQKTLLYAFDMAN